MKKYTITKEFKIYGAEIPEFPKGIKEAFDQLIATIPAGTGRPCFGLSRMKANGDILYIAAIEQKEENEGIKNNYNEYTIENGDYLCIEIQDWMEKIDMIKDSFEKMMHHPEALPDAWCIEWYGSDKEMMCLLKTK